MVPRRNARVPRRAPFERALAHARLLRSESPRSRAERAFRGQAESRKTSVDASQPRNLAPAVLPGLKHKLRWRLNRRRCMSAAEVAFRLARALRAHAERSGLARESDIPAPALAGKPQPWLKLPKADPSPYVAAANRIADGYLEVFALERVHLGWPPRWNRDPKTGIEAPLTFGKLLDYRDADLVGDIKYLWEPNRHLHFVTLAQAYALTQERRFCDVLAEHLESWFLSCPFGYGPNGASALEAAIRLINWSAAWQLVGGFEAPMFARHPELRLLWLRSVYEHVEFIRGWYSRHSSANNHLIGEAAGVFIAALTWPYWPRMRRAAAQAKGILESEMLHQNAPDGVDRDQAVAYQHFELDLLVLCLLAGKANGQWFSPAYESRLEAMFDYLASIMDCTGNVPMFGDSDDGCALRLAQEAAFSPYRSLLATGAILFRRGDFKLKSARLDDKTRWLFGAEADSCYAELDAEKTRLPPRQAFHDGGYYILGCEFETPNEIRVLADAGPLGYRSIAAHGHADALSFTLSAGGREFFIDPGTYAYPTPADSPRY